MKPVLIASIVTAIDLLALRPAAAAGPELAPSDPAPTGPAAEDGRVGPLPTSGAAESVEPREDPVVVALTPVRGGLTSDEVARKAVATAPMLEARRAEVSVAAAEVDQTMAVFLPRVELSARYTRLSNVNVTFGDGALVGALNDGVLGVGMCPDGTSTCVVDSAGVPVGATAFQIPQVLNQYSTQASLSVPLSDYVFRLMQGLDAAKSGRKAAEITRDAEERKIQLDARLAYYDWLRAKAQVAVAQDSVVTAKARLAEAEAGKKAGVVAKVDVLRLESLVANAEAMVARTESFEAVARRALAVTMGEPVRDYEVGESVLGSTMEAARWPELDALVDEAQANRMELRALQANDRAIRSGLKTERAGLFPRLDAFAEVTYANPNQRFFPLQQKWNSTWSAGIALTYNLTGIASARANRKKLRAQAKALDAQGEALRRGIELEVAAAHAAHENALVAIRLGEKARETSDAAYEATTAQFKAGTATATDLIEAQGERITADLQVVNARIDLKVADAKLRYATGRPDADVRS